MHNDEMDRPADHQHETPSEEADRRHQRPDGAPMPADPQTGDTMEGEPAQDDPMEDDVPPMGEDARTDASGMGVTAPSRGEPLRERAEPGEEAAPGVGPV